MVVDDSPATLASIDFMLTKALFATQMVLSAEDALRLLKGGVAPDVIITDLNMGAMNGIELIREARKIPTLRNVPMLILTTASQSYKRSEAKAAGASGWLVKPIADAALLDVLRQVFPDKPTGNA